MFGRGLVSLAAAAALVVFAGQAFAQQDEPYVPVPGPDGLPPIPKEIDDRLPDLQERHPWVPGECGGDSDGCPVPLLTAAVEGSFKYASKPNGEVFSCTLSVSAEHPNWENHDLRRVEFFGGARCTTRINTSGPGNLRLFGAPSSSELARTDITPEYQLSSGQWESSSDSYYDRANTNQSQNVWMRITLRIPDSLPAAKWDTLASDCVRNASIPREITCTLNSVAFQNLPYPCDTTNDTSPEFFGAQPGGCSPTGDLTQHSVPPDEDSMTPGTVGFEGDGVAGDGSDVLTEGSPALTGRRAAFAGERVIPYCRGHNGNLPHLGKCEIFPNPPYVFHNKVFRIGSQPDALVCERIISKTRGQNFSGKCQYIQGGEFIPGRWDDRYHSHGFGRDCGEYDGYNMYCRLWAAIQNKDGRRRVIKGEAEVWTG